MVVPPWHPSVESQQPAQHDPLQHLPVEQVVVTSVALLVPHTPSVHFGTLHSPAVQVEQPPPPVPQSSTVFPGRHVTPEMQPVQTHPPAWQVGVAVGQSTQETPPVPQASPAVPPWQPEAVSQQPAQQVPLQHLPVAQVVVTSGALSVPHDPKVHFATLHAPAEHTVHAPPPAPQAPAAVPATHAPPVTQPVQQL
jgi:hypothetical protein